MKLNELNIFIGTLIVSNIYDTESYSALRQSCSYFYFLMPEIKRFTNNQLTQIIKLKDHKVDGDVICYYPSGKIKSVSIYHLGIILTNTVHWDESGIISLQENYKDNKKNGKQMYYSKSGFLIKTIEYLNNKPHGKEIEYYTNGLIKYILNYINGKKDGMLIFFNEDGQKIITKNYSMGYLSGESKLYYENGAIKQETQYSCGKKNGLCLAYDINGNILLELNYKNNLKHGFLKEYEYSQGHLVLKIQCNFKNGLLYGFYRKYIMGKIYYECQYNENKIDGPAVIYNYGDIQFETYFNKGNIDFYHREYVNKVLSLNVIFHDKKVALCKKNGSVILSDIIYEGTAYWDNIMEKYKTILKNKLDISYIID